MIDPRAIIVTLAIIVVAQLGIIWGLLNRILRQAGLPRLNPLESIESASRKHDTAPVAKPRAVAGSQKVTV